MTMGPDHRQRLFAAFSIVLLVVTVARLSSLNINELRRYRETQNRNALIPQFGSLAGIDTQGEVRKLEPNGSDHSLVFVIRSDRVSSDIHFWNEVIGQVDSGPIPIRYWGICDAGVACNQYQQDANFPILGYLDPYQMRIVARAHAEDDVLLYDPSHTLKARVRRAKEPSVMSNAIEQGAK